MVPGFIGTPVLSNIPSEADSRREAESLRSLGSMFVILRALNDRRQRGLVMGGFETEILFLRHLLNNDLRRTPLVFMGPLNSSR